MKYPYKFRIIADCLHMDLPKQIDIVSLLLGDIECVGGDASSWLDAIDDVLEGRSKYKEGTGNSITTEITKTTTKLIHNFAADDDDECIIETTELKEIILIWLEEFRRFKAQKMPNC